MHFPDPEMDWSTVFYAGGDSTPDKEKDTEEDEVPTPELQKRLRKAFGIPLEDQVKEQEPAKKSKSKEKGQLKVDEMLRNLHKDLASEAKNSKKKASKKSEPAQKPDEQAAVTEEPKANSGRRKRSTSKMRIPPGWSFRAYTPTRGQKPKCKGCKCTIGYEDPCVRYSFYENSRFQHRTVHQFHCRRSCIEGGVKESPLEQFLEKHWLEQEVDQVKKEIVKTRRQKIEV